MATTKSQRGADIIAEYAAVGSQLGLSDEKILALADYTRVRCTARLNGPRWNTPIARPSASSHVADALGHSMLMIIIECLTLLSEFVSPCLVIAVLKRSSFRGRERP